MYSKWSLKIFLIFIQVQVLIAVHYAEFLDPDPKQFVENHANTLITAVVVVV